MFFSRIDAYGNWLTRYTPWDAHPNDPYENPNDPVEFNEDEQHMSAHDPDWIDPTAAADYAHYLWPYKYQLEYLEKFYPNVQHQVNRRRAVPYRERLDALLLSASVAMAGPSRMPRIKDWSIGMDFEHNGLTQCRIPDDPEFAQGQAPVMLRFVTNDQAYTVPSIPAHEFRLIKPDEWDSDLDDYPVDCGYDESVPGPTLEWRMAYKPSEAVLETWKERYKPISKGGDVLVGLEIRKSLTHSIEILKHFKETMDHRDIEVYFPDDD